MRHFLPSALLFKCNKNIFKLTSVLKLVSRYLTSMFILCSEKQKNLPNCIGLSSTQAFFQQSFLLWRVSLHPIQSRRVFILVCNYPSVSWSWQTLTHVLKLPGIALRFCLVWFLVLPTSHHNFPLLPLPNCRRLFIALLPTVKVCRSPNPFPTLHMHTRNNKKLLKELPIVLLPQ